MKATYGEITKYEMPVRHLGNLGECLIPEYIVEGKEIYKDPKTDDGLKKSAKGLLSVVLDDSTGKDVLKLHDQCTHDEEQKGLLEPVFCDGKLLKEESFDTIRQRLYQNN